MQEILECPKHGDAFRTGDCAVPWCSECRIRLRRHSKQRPRSTKFIKMKTTARKIPDEINNPTKDFGNNPSSTQQRTFRQGPLMCGTLQRCLPRLGFTLQLDQRLTRLCLPLLKIVLPCTLIILLLCLLLTCCVMKWRKARLNLCIFWMNHSFLTIPLISRHSTGMLMDEDTMSLLWKDITVVPLLLFFSIKRRYSSYDSHKDSELAVRSSFVGCRIRTASSMVVTTTAFKPVTKLIT